MKTKNNQTKNSVAILSADLNLSSDNDGWYQLLPAGKFKARDGRPFDVPDGHWYLDEAVAAAFIQKTIVESNNKPILIDYDHLTLHRQEHGQKTPAAGWIAHPSDDVKWRSDGIYIRPHWTPIARAEIDNREFNELSAVFEYDRETGQPIYLRMAAITNDPGLLGIQSLAALTAEFINNDQLEGDVMNELLRTILQSLGVISSDNDIDITADNVQRYAEQAVEAIANLKTTAEAAVNIKEVVDTTEGSSAIAERAQDIVAENADEIAETEKLIAEAELSSIDLSKYVPAPTYRAAMRQLAALSANNAQLSAEQLINNARNQGKILASEVPYYHGVARQQGIAALSALIDGRRPLAALTARQTSTVAVRKSNSQAELTASDLQVIAATGVNRDDYLKTKQEMINEN
ncbi:phage protease [Gilliamella sp. CG16]|uniref:phage protease n=1 Tax=Gilliamella sp. CG16 TaxID=3351503 RepID=UPI003987687F